MRSLILPVMVFSHAAWAGTILEKQAGCPKFPTRISIAVDVSASNEKTDPNGMRKPAVKQVLKDLGKAFAKAGMNPLTQIHLVAFDFHKLSPWRPLGDLPSAPILDQTTRAAGDNSTDFYRSMINSFRKLGNYKESELFFVVQDYDTYKVRRTGRKISDGSLNSPFLVSIVYGQTIQGTNPEPFHNGIHFTGSSTKLEDTMTGVAKFLAACLQNHKP